MTPSQHGPVREFVEEILLPFYLQCGAANLCLQVRLESEGESLFSQLKWCFLFNLKIFENMFSHSQRVSTPFAHLWGSFLTKKCPRPKPGRLLGGPLPVPVVEKRHANIPHMTLYLGILFLTLRLSFWSWSNSLTDTKTINSHPSSWSSDQIYQCLEEQRPLWEGQECQVWRELLVLQRAGGFQDFYWKKMWYNMII